MPMTRRARSPYLRVLALTITLASSAVCHAAGFEVVMKSGAIVAATTRPLIAMGKVSFLDGESRSRTLAVQAIDLEATRARLGSPEPTSRRWDGRSLQSAGGNIQVVGPVAATSADEDGDATTRSTDDNGVSLEDMSQVDRLRTEIAQIDKQIKPMNPSDRQRTVLMVRQLELQTELARVLHPDVKS
jgi:hypothetical protein